jgi:CheY-like chemotaxis protein
VQVQARHILREMGDIIRETFPRDIELRLEVSPGLAMIEADPTQIHQLVLNLCVNARDAMPEGGSLRLFAANRTLAATDVLLPNGVKPGGFIVIEVGDTGHGIPPEIKDRIFDPFFTTKPLGKGTGLGLSTVLGIVHGHGGFITVDSSPLQGTTFRVYLPAAAAAETAAEKPAPAVQAGQSQLILVVDDEPSIRQVVKLLLTARGYRVLTAVNGRDAVGLFEQHGDEIQLVVTDIMMPSMNGVALVQYLRKSNPRLAIVAMSGMSELPHHEELHRLAVAKILQKPAAEGELLSAIAEALQTPPPGG